MAAVEQIMGMPIVVGVRDDPAPTRAVADVFDWFRWVDAVFSTYKPDSQISRYNRGELAFADLHPDVMTVLGISEELRVQTNGYFDVRAASADSIDPSGLVKGWSVDRAAALLDEIPGAYKDLAQVMADQADLVAPEHSMREILNYKGS